MSEQATPKNQCLTVWKDGTHKVWSNGDAFYARNDPDWLMEFPLDTAPSPQPDGNGLGELLVQWAANEENVLKGDYGFCVICGIFISKEYETTHKPDCLHLQAKSYLAARNARAKEAGKAKYYRIIGGYTKLAIGWCEEGSKADVLREEPNATFEEITKEQYDKERGE